MSEKPERYSELDIAIMLVAVPVTVLIVVAVVNFLNERKMRLKESELPTNEYGSLNVHRISANMQTDNENQNTNANTTTSIPQPVQSDHQIIFGSTHAPSESIISIHSRSTDVPITTVIQEMDEVRRLADLQNEFERRAQERRDVLVNSSALHVPLASVNLNLHDHTPYYREIFPNSPPAESPADNQVFDRHQLPRYISQDDSLPSYDQAVLDESDLIRQ